MSVKNPGMFRLEDRVLFDAAGAVEAVAAAEAAEANPNANVSETEKQAQEEKDAVQNVPPENPADQAMRDDGGGQATPDEVADVNARVEQLIQGEIPMADMKLESGTLDVVSPELSLPDADSGAFVDALLTDSDSIISTGRELVVVNGSVPDKEAIIAELKPNQDVLILDDGSGLDQLNKYLDEHADVKYGAIHFVTHGNDGYFTVNGERVDAEHFDAAEWSAIGEHLTDDGDILLYGCNLAENAEGKQLADRIAVASGADVAASVDTTGLRGDWDLEYHYGAVETASLAIDDFSCDLTSYTVTSAADSGAGTFREALTLVADGDEIVFNIDGTDTINLNSTLTVTKSITIDGTNAGTGESGTAGDSVITLDGGGAVRIMTYSGTNLTIRDLNFTHGYVSSPNSGYDGGGAIRFNGISGNILIDSCSFSENAARGYGYGGAISCYEAPGGKITITGSDFTKNTTGRDGGAVSVYSYQQADATINDCTFTENLASSSEGIIGGAVAVRAGDTALGTAKLTGENCIFTDNQLLTTQGYSGNGGGAIGLLGASVNFQIKNFEFYGNKANTNGGALNAYAAKGTVTAEIDATVANNNSATQYSVAYGSFGGAFRLAGADGVDLTVEDTTGTGASKFDNNSAVTYGGAFHLEGRVVTARFDATTMNGNHANKSGGAVSIVSYTGGFSVSDATLLVTDYANTGHSSYSGNSTNNGTGGVFAFNVSNDINVTIDHAIFERNTAFDNGGVVGHFGNQPHNVNITVLSSTFRENASESYGGAIYLQNQFVGAGVLRIEDSLFEKNTAGTAMRDKQSGGAVSFGGFFAEVNRSVFRDNTATGDGGAISLSTFSKFSLSENSFFNNSAKYSGGAVYAKNSGSAQSTIADITVDGSLAGEDGGAIYVGSSNLLIDLGNNCTIANSKTSRNGGAIYINGDTAENITVKLHDGFNGSNSVAGYRASGTGAGSGGFLYFGNTSRTASVTIEMDHATLDGNQAADYGGAFALTLGNNYDLNTTFNNAVISNNTAGRSGGGVYLKYGTSAIDKVLSINIMDSKFESNKATANSGGGFFVDSYSDILLLAVNSVFTKNDASDGGGGMYLSAYNKDLTARFDGVTMTENHARINGAGVAAIAKTATLEVVDSAATGKSEYAGNKTDTGSANQGGGAFYLKTTSVTNVTFDSTYIHNNTVGGYGTALLLLNTGSEKSTVTISDTNGDGRSLYEDNTAAKSSLFYMKLGNNVAGALDLNVSDSVFKRNKATGFSGGVFFVYSYTNNTVVNNIHVENSTFDRNSTGAGGGVFILNAGTGTCGSFYITLDSVSITNSSASVYDGGVLSVNSVNYLSLVIKDDANPGHSIYSDNTAAREGGAFYVKAPNGILLDIKDSTITGNQTTGTNGGFARLLATTGIDINISNSIVSNNSANLIGGAIYAQSTSRDVNVTLDAVKMSGNETLAATGKGGAMAIVANSNATLNVTASEFNKNIANASGGVFDAIAGKSVSVHFDAADMEENTAQNGAGGVLNIALVSSNAVVDVKVTDSSNSGASKYLKNTALGYGGVIAVQTVGPTASISVDSTTMTENSVNGTSSANGGAIFLANTRTTASVNTVSLTNSLFKDNKSASRGGAFGFGTKSGDSDVFDTVECNLTVVNSRFEANTAAKSGGAIYLNANGVLNASASEFTQNISTAGNGGAIFAGKSLTVDDVTFTGNKASAADGGGIYLSENNTNAGIANSIFTQNSAITGGAVSSKSKSLVIGDTGNVVFTENSASNGGAIFHTGGDLSIANTDLNNNSAKFYGGAVSLSVDAANTVSVKDTVFTDNSTSEANSYGGAVFLTDTATYSLDNVQFKSNSSAGNGGAIALLGTNLTTDFKSVVIDGSYAENNGGALYAAGTNVNIDLDGTNSIKNSTSFNNGGAIYVAGKNATLTLHDGFAINASKAGFDQAGNANGTIGDGGSVYFTDEGYTSSTLNFTVNLAQITDNIANGNGGAFAIIAQNGHLNANIHVLNVSRNQAVNGAGGAFYIHGSSAADTFVFSDSNLTGNSAGTDGGAIALSGSINLAVANCTIDGNTADGNGGAIYLSTLSTAKISASNLNGNISQKSGGAVYSASGSLWIEYSTLAKNKADINGGAVANFGNVTIFNSTLAENTANLGGGLYTVNGGDVVDSTIACNVATANGGGIVNTSTAENSLKVLNSIIYSNKLGTLTAASTDNDIVSDSSFLMGYSVYNASAVSAFTALAYSVNYASTTNKQVFLLATGATDNTIPTLVTQSKRKVYIPQKWKSDLHDIHADVADRGTMVALKGGKFYYMDSRNNTDNTINYGSFYSLDTQSTAAIAASELVSRDEVGQNRLKNKDGFTIGAYTLPVQSLVVTTTYDIDDPWDDVISLREALENARDYYSVTGVVPEICFDIDADYELDGHPGVTNGDGPVHLKLSLDESGTGDFGMTVNAVNLDFAFTIDGTNYDFEHNVIRSGTSVSEVTVTSDSSKVVFDIVQLDPLFADANVEFRDITISNASATGIGAIALDRTGAVITLDRVSLDGNTGTGALSASDQIAQLNIYNSLIVDNNGYGIQSHAAKNVFVNDTVMNNSGTGISADQDTTILNSIVAGNLVQIAAGTVTVANSAVQGGYTGTGNLNLVRGGNYDYTVDGIDTASTVTANFEGGTGRAADRYSLSDKSYLINRGDNSKVIYNYHESGVNEALDRRGVLVDGSLSYRIQQGYADMGAVESAKKGVFFVNKFSEDSVTIVYGDTGSYSLSCDAPTSTLTLSDTLKKYVQKNGTDTLLAIWAMNNPSGGTTAPVAMTSVVDTTYFEEGDTVVSRTATLNVTTTKRAVGVKADSAEHEYDGILHSHTWTQSTGSLAFGDKITDVSVTSERNVLRDSSGNVIAYDAIAEVNQIRSSDNSKDVIGNYEISDTSTDASRKGTLKITPVSLTISFEAEDKVYDGNTNALRDGAFIYTGIIAGDTVSLDDSTMSYAFDTKNAGVDKTVTATGFDASLLGGAEAGNYEATFTDTALADITKRDVTITANSATKEYDGVALTDSGYALSGSGFVTGEGLDTVSVVGSQLFVGSSDNVVDSYALATGTLAGNYDITTAKGTLTITNDTKIELTVTADSDTKMYDGTALTDSGSTYTGTLATGDVLTVTTTGSQTNAGTGENSIDTITIMHGTTDVTSYYDVTEIAGSLEVTKRDVTITAGSAEKPYDGTPLTDSTYRISGSGFVAGEGIGNVTFTGSQTNVGSSPNIISGYQFSLGTLAENYDITLISGTLTVTPGTSPVTPDLYHGQNCYQDASTQFYCVNGVMPGGTDDLRTNSPEKWSVPDYKRMTSLVKDGEFSISDAVEQTPDFLIRPLEQDFKALSIRGAFDSGRATGILVFMHQPVKMLRSFFTGGDMPDESLSSDTPEYDLNGLPYNDLPRTNDVFKSDIERILDEMLEIQ